MNKLNKKEKRQLLKDVFSGKKSVNQIHGQRIEFWICDDHNPGMFYNELNHNEVITENELQLRKQKAGADDIIWIEVRAYEHEPLNIQA